MNGEIKVNGIYCDYIVDIDLVVFNNNIGLFLKGVWMNNYWVGEISDIVLKFVNM